MEDCQLSCTNIWESKRRGSLRYRDTENSRGSYTKLPTHLCL